MSHTIVLTESQMSIIRSLFNLADGLPICADELLDCDMEEYNDLSEVFDA